MFDFAVMERFGLARSALPAGSLVVNQPETGYQRYRTFMWVAGIAVLVLLLFTAALIVTILGRRAAERALRESEDRYRDLVENINDLICTHDLHGNLLFVNQAFFIQFQK